MNIKPCYTGEYAQRKNEYILHGLYQPRASALQKTPCRAANLMLMPLSASMDQALQVTRQQDDRACKDHGAARCKPSWYSAHCQTNRLLMIPRAWPQDHCTASGLASPAACRHVQETVRQPTSCACGHLPDPVTTLTPRTCRPAKHRWRHLYIHGGLCPPHCGCTAHGARHDIPVPPDEVRRPNALQNWLCPSLWLLLANRLVLA